MPESVRRILKAMPNENEIESAEICATNIIAASLNTRTNSESVDIGAKFIKLRDIAVANLIKGMAYRAISFADFQTALNSIIAKREKELE